MCLCALPSTWRCFDNQTSYSYTEISECILYARSSTHGRGAERFGMCEPKKTKWVIKLPLRLCVPVQLCLIFAKENKVVHFICMLKDALGLSLSFPHSPAP